MTIYYWDKEIKKVACPEADLKNHDLMFLAQRMHHFLQDVFQMTAIALVLVINYNH